jgi:Ku protein
MAAARRAYWKGYLRLSLVTCPIALYPAFSQAEKTHFHQINCRTGNRLRQKMVDEKTGEVVETVEKCRGYEIAKGKYVKVEPEALEAIRVESAHTLDVDKFVPIEEIDRRYFDRPYYIAPDGKGGEEAFVVIRDAMKRKGRAALAKIVLTNREHVMAIEPFDKIMLGIILRYDYELRDEKDLSRTIPSLKIPKEMLSLASHILDTKAGHFDPSQFKDEFELELRKLVKRKAAGETIEAPKEQQRPSNVVDLMEALRQSVKNDKRVATKSSLGRKMSKPKARRVSSRRHAMASRSSP